MTTIELKSKLEKTMDVLGQELRSLRVGRASADLVEDLMVNAYDVKTPLSQIASIQIPQHDQIIIQPWDAGLLKSVEEAIRNSDLNLNPVVESNVVRINLPPLTEESRKDLVKLVAKHVEDSRIAVRNIREEAMEEIEKEFKDKEISEDDKFRQKDEVQKMVDEYNSKIKEVSENKEQEILKV